MTNNILRWKDGGTDDECMELCLDNFNAAQAELGSGNNTVSINFVAPTESSRFTFVFILLSKYLCVLACGCLYLFVYFC